MRLVKQSLFTGSGGGGFRTHGGQRGNDADYLLSLDTDLKNLFLFTQGRVRFGSGANNQTGENISGEWVTFQAPTDVNTDVKVAHGLGVIPEGYIVLKKDGIGELYAGTTTNTTTDMYFRSSGSGSNLYTGINYTVFLLK